MRREIFERRQVRLQALRLFITQRYGHTVEIGPVPATP